MKVSITAVATKTFTAASAGSAWIWWTSKRGFSLASARASLRIFYFLGKRNKTALCDKGLRRLSVVRGRPDDNPAIVIARV
jgi:hypothetical protein